jgi:hypothetical protein
MNSTQLKIASMTTIVVQPDAMMVGAWALQSATMRDRWSASPLATRGQALLNLNRCGSMRHIEDAVTLIDKAHQPGFAPQPALHHARALINAFVEEACSRGVRRIWVASYDFQAPGMNEKAGFKRVAEFEGWPEGHVNVLLCKTL